MNRRQAAGLLVVVGVLALVRRTARAAAPARRRSPRRVRTERRADAPTIDLTRKEDLGALRRRYGVLADRAASDATDRAIEEKRGAREQEMIAETARLQAISVALREDRLKASDVIESMQKFKATGDFLYSYLVALDRAESGPRRVAALVFE